MEPPKIWGGGNNGSYIIGTTYNVTNRYNSVTFNGTTIILILQFAYIGSNVLNIYYNRNTNKIIGSYCTNNSNYIGIISVDSSNNITISAASSTSTSGSDDITICNINNGIFTPNANFSSIIMNLSYMILS